MLHGFAPAGTLLAAFDPPRLLRSPHLQTVASRWIPAPAAQALPGEAAVLENAAGVRLKAFVSPGKPGAPLAIVIHGWLGCERSSYVRRAAASLGAGGCGVARLLLRDHGDTANLNREMFNSARLDEVADACNQLMERSAAAGGAAAGGIVGFSLGGNFALRLACDARLDQRFAACLAISPVVDPAATVRAIDGGWSAYRLWFVRYWRQALAAKAAAFPGVYGRLDETLRLSTVSAITDYLTRRHLPFANSADYYARYDLRGGRLAGLRFPARIVAALDDPVIPSAGFADLARSPNLTLELWPHGGHCGFLADWRFASYLDAATTRWFANALLAAA